MTYLQTVILSVTAAIGTTIGLWLGDNNPSTEIVSVAVMRPVQPGGQMMVTYRVNRYRLCDRTVFREIIDGEGMRHVLGEQVRPSPGALGYDEYVQPVHVPPSVSPGEGEYRVTVREFCNPLRKFWPITRSIRVPILIAWNPGTPEPPLRP